MGGIDNVSSTLRLIENLKNEGKRGKKEVIDLFKKIFIALDAHTDTPSVNKGLDDLAVDVCDLEEKLSMITKERDNLLDTVDILKAEIRQLSANLMTTMMPLPVPDQRVNQSREIQEVEILDISSKESPMSPPENLKLPAGINITSTGKGMVKIRALSNAPRSAGAISSAAGSAVGQGQKRPRTAQKYRMKAHIGEVHEKIKNHRCEGCGYATSRKDRLEKHWDAVHNMGDKKFKRGRIRKKGGDQKRKNKTKKKMKQQQQQIHKSLNDPYISDNNDLNGVEDADVKEIEHVAPDREVSQTKDLIQAQIREGHDNVEKNENQDYEYHAPQMLIQELQETPNKKFKCDQCPYSSDQKARVERHWDGVHNMGDKKYKCLRCPYSSAENSKLKKHIERNCIETARLAKSLKMKSEDTLPQ